MTERAVMTREEILNAFPPKQEIIKGKSGEDVPYRISRNPNLVSQDPNGLILHAVPEAEWLKRGEQPEN